MTLSGPVWRREPPTSLQFLSHPAFASTSRSHNTSQNLVKNPFASACNIWHNKTLLAPLTNKDYLPCNNLQIDLRESGQTRGYGHWLLSRMSSSCQNHNWIQFHNKEYLHQAYLLNAFMGEVTDRPKHLPTKEVGWFTSLERHKEVYNPAHVNLQDFCTFYQNPLLKGLLLTNYYHNVLPYLIDKWFIPYSFHCIEVTTPNCRYLHMFSTFIATTADGQHLFVSSIPTNITYLDLPRKSWFLGPDHWKCWKPILTFFRPFKYWSDMLNYWSEKNDWQASAIYNAYIFNK